MSATATLGALFAIVGFAAMFLMYHLWGYPFDKATKTSAAPRWAMYLHRGLGYVFAIIYVVLMWKMVPRMWEYQVEFPARTTAHIVLGFTIGFLLLVKIAIMRFFRHFEEWMPALGTSIMLGTLILLGLSLPFALQERALSDEAMTAASQARVAKLLPTAGLPADAPLADLATEKSLRAGRKVLLDNCVKCHDLRTILNKPRTPNGWWTTVERMADKPALFDPMTERETYDVTAYLIAITPDLQKSTKSKRQQTVARAAATMAVPAQPARPIEPPPGSGSAMSGSGSATPADAMAGSGSAAPPAPAVAASAPPSAGELATAKATYERVCSGCHDVSDTNNAPPKTPAESRALIQRMIDHDAVIKPDEVQAIAAYLDAEFVNKMK